MKNKILAHKHSSKNDDKTSMEASANALVEKFLKIDKYVQVPLKKEELLEIKKNYLVVERFKKEFRKQELFNLKQGIKNIQKKIKLNTFNDTDRLKYLALSREILYRTNKIFLYDTQLFTVLGLLNDPISNPLGRVAQVLTGEGKSAIFAILASVFGTFEGPVDIKQTKPE